MPLAQLTRKELQARAIKAGLKANAKSSELVKALESMEQIAAAGEAVMQMVAPAGLKSGKEESDEARHWPPSPG